MIGPTIVLHKQQDVFARREGDAAQLRNLLEHATSGTRRQWQEDAQAVLVARLRRVRARALLQSVTDPTERKRLRDALTKMFARVRARRYYLRTTHRGGQ